MSKKGKKDNRKIIKIGNFSPSNHYGKNVYSIEGLSPTLCSGSVVKNGLNIMENQENNKIIEKHFTEVDEDRKITVDKEKKNCYAINTRQLKVSTNTEKGYDSADIGDGVRLDHPSGETGRGRVQKNKTGTLSCNPNWGTVTPNFRIRRLTPVECERLQGFPDDWTKYGVDNEMISDTQRYKCMGNAVTVPVITFIINEMFEGINE